MKMKPPHPQRYNGRAVTPADVVDVLPIDVEPLKAEGWAVVEADDKPKKKER